MLSKHLRRFLAISAVTAVAATASGVAASGAADVNCLSTITPLTAKAAAILGYSVKAVRGGDAQNCNFLHFPIKLVDINNFRVPVHPTIGVSFNHKTLAAFSASMKSVRSGAQKHNGFIALAGLGPRATLIHDSIEGNGSLRIYTYVHGRYMSLSVSGGATPVSDAQAVALARAIAARI